MREQLVCRLLQLASTLGSGWITLGFVIFGVALCLALPLARFVVRRLEPGSPAPGPARLVAAWLAVGLYTLGRLVDPLLASQLVRPPTFPREVWAHVGWFEWKLLGGSPWMWPLLPLADHPALGLLLHGVLWLAVIAALAWLLRRMPGGRGGRAVRGVETLWDTPEGAVPWYHRWAGATTARRADDRFKRWSRALLAVLIPLHLTAGGLMAAAAPDAGGATHRVDCRERIVTPRVDLPSHPAHASAWPAAGTWVLGYYLLLTWALHLMLAGRPPDDDGEERTDEPEDQAAAAPPDPLSRLGDALRTRGPEVRLAALERHAPRPAQTVPLPDCFGPVVRELAESLTGTDTLYSHQREVLDYLVGHWWRAPQTHRGPTPSLDEEVLRSPVRDREEPPHALMLAPEGSGRTTLTLLAALHLHFDRGATTLALLPDRAAARRWAGLLRETLLSSIARWNVHVCVAGDDLAAALVGGKTPSVIVADVESFESEVLAEPRTDAFIDRLGLLVVDDLDEFVGVAEMHTHLLTRRLRALVDTRRHAGERTHDLAVLATAGPPAPPTSGIEGWAHHLLAVPLRVFDGDGAPRVPRVVLRRRDLADTQGSPVPLSRLAEACEEAGIPWHMRMAGDGQRAVQRATIDLARLRRYRTADPRQAEVVLLEGRYPDVRREAARMAHAGVAAPGAAAVLVLAPPADEEMVLHEEADDAPLQPLVESLPRSVVLAEPDLVRQRHFERCLGREHDVEALRARLGAHFVDETLARLSAAGRIRQRRVWYFDRRRDDVASRTFVRAVGEAALGEPIHRDCVSDSSERIGVIDQGSGDELAVVDRAVAALRYPPGAVFLHPRGRFQVVGADSTTIVAVPLAERCRTTPDVEVRVDLDPDAPLSDRQLGGATVRTGLFRAEVEERVVGMRRYGPGPTLLEHRRIESPPTARYATDVYVLATKPRRGEGTEGEALGRGALRPLSAAMRMMLPCALRGAEGLVDVTVVELAEGPHLAIYDRTPGGSGYANHLSRDGLRDLLLLTRLVLERLVGVEAVRLRRLHDTGSPSEDAARPVGEGDALSSAPGRTRGAEASRPGDSVPWDFRGALTFLDEVLDAPHHERPPQRRPRREYVPGEGPGDLGRLWIARTGRTDDLAWTRHRWERDDVPVHFDVAVERRAIADTLAQAARLGVDRHPVMPREAAAWGAAHRALLDLDAPELDDLRHQIAALAGERGVDFVLGLVAAIPTYPRPLSPVERAPLVVLARRRGDLDGKVLAAFALLPSAANAAILVGPRGCLLAVDGRYWDLSGPTPEVTDGADATVALP